MYEPFFGGRNPYGQSFLHWDISVHSKINVNTNMWSQILSLNQKTSARGNASFQEKLAKAFQNYYSLKIVKTEPLQRLTSLYPENCKIFLFLQDFFTRNLLDTWQLVDAIKIILQMAQILIENIKLNPPLFMVYLSSYLVKQFCVTEKERLTS